jgi:hypothetical protein
MRQNFPTVAMVVSLALLLGSLIILVSWCGVKPDSPLANTLTTGAIAGLSLPKGEAAKDIPDKSN